MYEADRNIIKAFVSEVYHWLHACYVPQAIPGAFTFPKIPVRPDFQPNASEAWSVFSQRVPLSALTTAIDKASAAGLEDHGLFGPELGYKLKTIDHAKTKATGLFTGWKKKLLELIDNLLDSIIEVLGAGGAMKELKDALVGSIDD